MIHRERRIGSVCAHLGHENVFAAETIVWVGVMGVDRGYRDGGIFAKVLHCRHLRLSFESWHEPTSHSSD